MIATQELTRDQLRQLEQDLVGERARLERWLETQSAPDVATSAAPAVSRVPSSEEGGVALALATRSHARHAAVVEALARLEAGTYGLCASCDGQIPFGRLFVMPEATHCVACGLRG